MQRALQVAADILSRILCSPQRNNKHFFKESVAFFSVQSLLYSSLRLMLLNVLPNNLPIPHEVPLNCVLIHGRIQINVFIQKNVDHIHNYVQKSFLNAWKVCKYGVFSGTYFPAFGLNPMIFLSYILSRIMLSFFLIF